MLSIRLSQSKYIIPAIGNKVIFVAIATLHPTSNVYCQWCSSFDCENTEQEIIIIKILIPSPNETSQSFSSAWESSRVVCSTERTLSAEMLILLNVDSDSQFILFRAKSPKHSYILPPKLTQLTVT